MDDFLTPSSQTYLIFPYRNNIIFSNLKWILLLSYIQLWRPSKKANFSWRFLSTSNIHWLYLCRALRWALGRGGLKGEARGCSRWAAKREEHPTVTTVMLFLTFTHNKNPPGNPEWSLSKPPIWQLTAICPVQSEITDCESWEKQMLSESQWGDACLLTFDKHLAALTLLFWPAKVDLRSCAGPLPEHHFL